MKTIGTYLLAASLCIFVWACGDDDETQATPDISIIQGEYITTIQHDVISTAYGFEEIDTSYVEDFFRTSVTMDGNNVTFRFPKGSRYELPDLSYEVRDVEKHEIRDDYYVYLTLRTTNEYRMKTAPNQMVSPAFRIFDDQPQNQYKVELYLFLRSQDPDSVYNVYVKGYK
jgi:hypothetical protein